MVQANEQEGDAAQRAAALEHFELEVRPLLATHCFKCHSGGAAKGNLRLDARSSILAGGDSGPAVEIGDPSSSLLIAAVRHESLEMPPKEKLTDDEIRELEHWIANGLTWPAEDALRGAAITDADRHYWAFQPIQDPIPPRLEADNWSFNGIDRFVLEQLRASGLSPNEGASRETLIRRVYFDMLGIPPSLEQVHDFVHDPSHDAYERLVERVLASPAYGERWGRHWLDLVRYAESDGYRQDAYRDLAWRYRDYVISALNDDKSYDQFIIEQLAGDEAAGSDPAKVIATGYLRLPLYEYNQRDARTQRKEILNDITDVTGEVFLGFGYRCARCHDHKYDPILQADYYRLQAFFAPLIARDAVPLLGTADLAEFQQRQHDWECATRDIREEIAAIRQPYLDRAANGAIAKFPPDLQQIARKSETELTAEEQQLAYFINRQIAFEHANIKLNDKDMARMRELEGELSKLNHLKPAVPPTYDTVGEAQGTVPDTFVSTGVDQAPIELGYPSVIEHLFREPMPTPTEQQTSGRRTELARWLVDDANPLPARVIANRLWQHHFGRGLVANASDFGKLGPGPSHPALLDWLASRLRENDWHWKPIHRLILLSSTYRQDASRQDLASCQAIDPSNQTYYRFEPRRLSAEQIRDSILAVSGELNDQFAGPSCKVDEGRRSIYCRVVRNSPHPLLSLFDGADGVNSVAQRSSTTTANQALALLNDEWVLNAARRLGERCDRVSDIQDDAWIEYAYRTIFARTPRAAEVVEIRDYMHHVACSNDRPAVEIMTDVCHVLLNSNEFLYVD